MSADVFGGKAGLAHGDEDAGAAPGAGGFGEDDLDKGAVVSFVDRSRDDVDEIATGEAVGRPDISGNHLTCAGTHH